MNLPRSVARHVQTSLLVEAQTDGPEAAVGAGPRVLVLHDGDLGRLARHGGDGLAVLEVEAHDAVPIWGVPVPVWEGISVSLELAVPGFCLRFRVKRRLGSARQGVYGGFLTSFRGKQHMRPCRWR